MSAKWRCFINCAFLQTRCSEVSDLQAPHTKKPLAEGAFLFIQS
jgi:hypothetical protein